MSAWTPRYRTVCVWITVIVIVAVAYPLSFGPCQYMLPYLPPSTQKLGYCYYYPLITADAAGESALFGLFRDYFSWFNRLRQEREYERLLIRDWNRFHAESDRGLEMPPAWYGRRVIVNPAESP